LWCAIEEQSKAFIFIQQVQNIKDKEKGVAFEPLFLFFKKLNIDL